MPANPSPNPARFLQDVESIKSIAGFEVALSYAVQSFELMEIYQTPPIPKAYEIFYGYASGKPAAVVERVDVAVAQTGSLDLHQIYQIHNDLFSYPEALQAEQDKTTSALDDQLKAVLEHVASYLRSSDEHSEALDRATESIGPEATPALLRQTIDFLIAENTRARRETKALSQSLEQSQENIQSMRENLTKVREAGFRDALTSLKNRRHFDQALPEAIEVARNKGTRLCLCLMDIDHFKSINDTFGHPAGDSVLRIVGALLSENVKGRDTPVRHGGEEFAIILPETDIMGAVSLAAKIRRHLERKNLVLREAQTAIGKITASFGVSELKADDSAQSLIERADTNLYKAKRTGRNKVVSDAD